jgi:hypothetical protein
MGSRGRGARCLNKGFVFLCGVDLSFRFFFRAFGFFRAISVAMDDGDEKAGRLSRSLSFSHSHGDHLVYLGRRSGEPKREKKKIWGWPRRKKYGGPLV